MSLTYLLLAGAALALTCFFSGSEAGDVGVCYGMQGDNLIDPPAVVRLLQNKGIKMVTLYDTNADALHALANSGIKVGVALPNENLAAAGSMSYAVKWVQDNVQAYYPSTLINNVAVGNEVFYQRPDLTSQLLPAMQNIQAALASAGLADAVKVFTPIAMDALKDPTFPPSRGEFRDDLKPVMSQMLDFLQRTGSFISFNIYPYIAYRDHPDTVDFDFVMFRATKYDSGNGLAYGSLYEAMVDAAFHAVEKLSNSRLQHATPGRKLGAAEDLTQSLVWRDHGFPHGQLGPPLKHSRSGLAEQKSSAVATPENARIYNSNVIGKMLRGGGTPYRPNAVISGYIFSLFDEDKKTGGDVDEQNFGIFFPDGKPVYQVDFTHAGPAPPSWCTANAVVGNTRLQAALDYACGHGADCSAIQPGKSCYNPNTVFAHASYAFNSYYQSNGRVSGSCDFSGAATVVYYQQPAGTCDPNAASWCVANGAVGDARLQAALDYACGHGADCSAIQAGGRCFNPNTKVAHASYAFNDYYHKNGQTDQSCSFGGCGSVVHQQPKYGDCAL